MLSERAAAVSEKTPYLCVENFPLTGYIRPMKRRVYLDHLSGTPLAPEVREAMRPFFEEHTYGLAAREAIASARGQCAQLIGGMPEEILFTSSGTEANNLAVKGTALAQRSRGNHIVLSNIEHPSINQSIHPSIIHPSIHHPSKGDGGDGGGGGGRISQPVQTHIPTHPGMKYPVRGNPSL